MTVLAKNIVRKHKAHQRRLNVIGANAGEAFFTGAYVLREAAADLGTNVVGAGLVPLGVLVEPLFPDDPDQLAHHLDNTNGSDGVVTGGQDEAERALRYDQAGEYAFAVSGATPKTEDPAYLVDNNTVSAADPGHGIVAGVFTRPAGGGEWYVDIARRTA